MIFKMESMILKQL